MAGTARDGAVVSHVLSWGRRELRDLPWRRTRDPWAVLVSETMLQQTQVARVIDRLPRFLDRFPTVAACADGPVADVVAEWSGLGYNRRPVSLHRATELMVARHASQVPDTLPDLLALPGIGPYTARAVLAFAFEQPAAVVDTNIGRILARVDGRTFRPAEVQQRADQLASHEAVSGEFWWWNQSVMELAAVVCTARTPNCAGCPLVSHCRWKGQGVDPAKGSAGVSRPQARFAGSDRQLRGRLVEALRGGSIMVDKLADTIGCDDPDRIAQILEGLARDGLIQQRGDHLMLPGR